MSAERRQPWTDALLLALAFIVFVTLIALGTWQIQRLQWKLDLIEAVEARAFGEPVAAPKGDVSAEDHAYLRIAVDGTYRHDLTREVKAITELGSGRWVMTPLRTSKSHIWINRGFVPTGSAPDDWTRPSGRAEVSGLLRITEPDGTLLEKNVPDEARWYSRDVATLSEAAGLEGFAPYFIDADHTGEPAGWPRGGLTVVKFRNPHLAYALTWYAMAALFLGGMIYVIKDRRRARSDITPSSAP